MKTGLARLAEAVRRYNPRSLSEHLRRDDNGVVYVDKKSLFGDLTEDSEEVLYFQTVFEIRYSWGWRNWENATIYFEVDGDFIRGGAYYLDMKKKGRLRVVARRVDGVHAGYYSQYKDEEYDRICAIINNCA